MSETALTVSEGSYREIAPVAERGLAITPASSPVTQWGIVPVPPSWTRLRKVRDPETKQIVQEEVPYFIDMKALQESTPKHERKKHFKGYSYTTADFARKQLNKIFDIGRWMFYETDYEVGREYVQLVGQKQEPKKYREVKVRGYLLCPGYPPVLGEGSAPWAQDDVNDPRFFEVTAKKAAVSLAIKAAAKQGFNIGADVSEDTEATAIVSGMQTTIVNIYKQLRDRDGTTKKNALNIIRRYCPIAIDGEEVIAEALDEGVLDDMLKELTALITKAA
jgi:hypothetical protein